MAEPVSAASPDEFRTIAEVIQAQRFPKGIKPTNYSIEFGEDSTGQPSVWIFLGVDEDHQDPPKGWISEVGDFVSQLRKSLLDNRRVRHWPYIELKASRN